MSGWGARPRSRAPPSRGRVRPGCGVESVSRPRPWLGARCRRDRGRSPRQRHRTTHNARGQIVTTLTRRKRENPKTPALVQVSLVGDTGLELASGAQVRPDCPDLLGFSALRSAQVRSNCYQNCYQARASRGVSIESMTTRAQAAENAPASVHAEGLDPPRHCCVADRVRRCQPQAGAQLHGHGAICTWMLWEPRLSAR